MRRAVWLLLFLSLACSDEEKALPLSVAGEKLHTVRGIVLSRNEGMNSVNLDHEEIPGFMTAMQMDYTVRGAKVMALPPDRSRIQAKLHVTDRAYWITDVKPIK